MEKLKKKNTICINVNLILFESFFLKLGITNYSNPFLEYVVNITFSKLKDM